MNKISCAFLLLGALWVAGCSDLATDLSTATPPLTLTLVPAATPTLPPTQTPIPTPILTPTVTPRQSVTIEPYTNLFPLAEPLLPLSAAQLKEVRECAVEELATTRYPEAAPIDDLIYLFTPENACDWASLAYAYTERLQDKQEMPEVAKNAFGQAIANNIGFALSTPLFYRYYYDTFTIVAAPARFEQDIVKVQIKYTWSGIGDPVEYQLEISQANTNPIVALQSYTPTTLPESAKTTVNSATVQALGKALINWVPIDAQFALTPCYDNYPDWTTTLTMQDGTTLELKTHDSNMIYMGGPWQTTFEGQNYVLFSLEFVKALDTLIQEIGLPYGQPMALTCSAAEVFEQAYPE